ncbi:MAG: sugar transferase [Pacificimonas sp.]
MTTKRPVVRGRGVLQNPAVQYFLGIVLAVLVPVSMTILLVPRASLDATMAMTALGAGCAAMGGIFMFRRFDVFPGIQRFAYVAPSFLVSYTVVLAIFFFARLDYSRLLYGLSFAASIGLFLLVCRYARRVARQRFYVVPFGNVTWLADREDLDVMFLQEPIFPREPDAVLVADLRADLGGGWERMIAETAISGRAVYHTKQLRESIEGRVQIEHLSENSFGSLLPNLNYRNVKRAGDFIAALLALPIVGVVFLIVAPLIKITSPGPVLFRQERMGYRSATFSVMKFRTMKVARVSETQEERRQAAMTKTNDDRITAFGRFLRRSRIDEIPQILNVLKGDMSFIGPRPEAMDLADWYEEKLPFYSYRHIVRPGITGWAQVNQGHVAELDDVREKLHYDFYYIKNFSAWLDMVIALQTVTIIVTGFGSK